MAQNRLNLPSMVKRHIGSNAIKAEAFFDALVIAGSSNNQEPKDEQIEITDVEPSVNSIVAMVHKDLNEVRMAKARARISPDVTIYTSSMPQKPIATLKPPSYNMDTSIVYPRREPNFKADLPNKSISKLKAKWQAKHQQRLRRSIASPNEPNDFENQKRLQEVQRQRHILEEILEEHEKIQRDRNSITREIRTMKDYLSEIRCKLDTSLKKLGAHKTMMEQNAKATKTSSVRNKAVGVKHRKTVNRSFIV